MVRGVRVSRMQRVSKVIFNAKKTLNACYCYVFVVHCVSQTGCKGGLFWGTKKFFLTFFQKKITTSSINFTLKWIKNATK